jgi:uncharacterized protein YrrD
MVRLQHILGLPVIDSQTGKLAGAVKDIWFDEQCLLRGLILKAGKWWFKTLFVFVEWNDVLATGDDGIIITSKAIIRKSGAGEISRTFHTGVNQLKDLPVMTSEGQQLGRVSDVYFEPDMGTPIVSYELTDGFVSDVMEGRKCLRIPAHPNEVTLGEDCILVPAHYEEFLEKIVPS